MQWIEKAITGLTTQSGFPHCVVAEWPAAEGIAPRVEGIAGLLTVFVELGKAFSEVKGDRGASTQRIQQLHTLVHTELPKKIEAFED